MTLVLAFDTSAAACAAAVLSGQAVLAQAEEPMATGQAERLIPLCEELLARVDAGWHDLSVLGVGTGPGNFTGVRISVAAARGLALSLGVPAIGVTRLEALAEGLPRPLAVVEDARRGAVYLQLFGPDGPPDFSGCALAQRSSGIALKPLRLEPPAEPAIAATRESNALRSPSRSTRPALSAACDIRPPASPMIAVGRST